VGFASFGFRGLFGGVPPGQTASVISALLKRVLFALVGACGLLGAEATSPTGTNLPSASGEYLIQQWTSDDGLPQNSVIAIAQTTDGYLWLSTFGGLARFDGVRFEVFDADRVPGLASYYTCLSADRENGLWLSGSDGWVAHYADGRFRRLTEADGLPGGTAPRIETAPDGTVWAGAKDGRLLRWEGQRFVVAAEAPRPDWGELWQLVFDHSGRIWTEQVGEFAYLEQNRWHRFKPTGEGRAGSGIVPLPDGSVLLEGVPRGTHLLRHYQGSLELFERFPFPNRSGARFCREREGTLWCLNQGPLFRRGPAGGWAEVGRETALASNAHRAALEDREGNLWIGTDGAGLFRLRRRSVRAVGTAEGLTRPVVLSVAVRPDGEVVTAVHGRGVQRFDGQRFSQVLRPPALTDSQLAWCVWPRPDGGLWVGSYGLGLFDIPSGSATPRTWLPTNAPGLIGGPIFALLEDSLGQLWVGGAEGLSRRAQGQFRRWTQTNGLPDNYVGALAEAGAGAVWAGGNRGLVRVDETGTRTFTRADGLAHDHVRSLFRDADGTLWIGGGGLTRFKAGKFTQIRAAGGLPVETIKSIVADDYGALWWGTPRGVFRCAKSELDEFCEGRRPRIETARFDRADGMPSNECGGIQPAVSKGPDGRLWFATLNGLAIIDPRNLPKNPLVPPVVIEQVTADGKVREAVAGRVTIPAGTLLTEFTFTGLSFVAPERNRFRCRLVGYEEEFRDVGTARSAAYTRLRPGHYTLRVTAANGDGVWNEAGAQLAVIVQPFFWETTPFRIIVGVTALIVLAAGVRWLAQRRLRLQVAELERDQAVNRERARIARNMHDDVGASLTQIGLLSELARRQLNDPAGTEARLDELGNLSRDVVRNLDAMVWTVDPEHDTVAGMVEYLAGFAQEYVAPAGWACRLDLPPKLPNDPIPAPTRHHVLLLVKEALNNALKHSGATEVTLRAAVEGGTLRLELADNGHGFDPATSGRFSDGLGNMRERARLAGGRCTITSTPGTGTKITVELPLD
jgi:signal transduction histidine kinase/ligand-binding sensor domain-containing protein